MHDQRLRIILLAMVFALPPLIDAAAPTFPKAGSDVPAYSWRWPVQPMTYALEAVMVVTVGMVEWLRAGSPAQSPAATETATALPRRRRVWL